MEVDKEIHALSAETLALTAILSSVLGRLAATDRTMRFNIAEGFSQAADQVEAVALTFGHAASSKHTVKALQIVEQLRTAVLGPDRPSGMNFP